MKKNTVHISLMILLSFSSLACSHNSEAPLEKSVKATAMAKGQHMNDGKITTAQSIPEEQQISLQAKVQFFALEGGFYGLITKQGKHYLPLNLAKEFQQNGAIVNVRGIVKPRMMTIQQWGTPFTITGIKLIKAGLSPNNDQLL